MTILPKVQRGSLVRRRRARGSVRWFGVPEVLPPLVWWVVGDPPVWVEWWGDDRRRRLAGQQGLDSWEADLDHVWRVLAQYVQNGSLDVEEGAEGTARHDAVEEAEVALPEPGKFGGGTPGHLAGVVGGDEPLVLARCRLDRAPRVLRGWATFLR